MIYDRVHWSENGRSSGVALRKAERAQCAAKNAYITGGNYYESDAGFY